MALSSRQKNKFGKVMDDFQQGNLISPQGTKITNPNQALDIGFEEIGMTKKPKRIKSINF